ncbi:MAG: DUF429 domain-containing protein [Deltaproteobacteria bacterium]|nr:DUF429 domain-containing protein [Deltaproteobacteria bacterium]
MRYLGLDLGWTPRDSSGGVILEPAEGGVRVESADSLRAHEDTLRWLARSRGRTGCILATNAPIVVENLSGSRPCDKQLAEHFSRYRIDEYANNTVSASHPRTMAKGLVRMGFDINPAAGAAERLVETHTQSAQVLLFGIDRPVRMKAGPIGGRKEGVARLRELIVEKLYTGTPRLLPSPALETLMSAHLPDLNGTRLGELEERLEALLVAYVAAWLGENSVTGCAFLGDLTRGYILLPDPSRIEPRG